MGVFSDDPKDGEVMTPVHLTCGTKLETFPTIKTPRESDISNCTATTKWAHIQNVLLHFWKRWNKDDVTFLPGRKKWSKEVSNVKICGVVSIIDNKVALLQCPLGRLVRVYNSLDNFVRVFRVRTQSGVYNRAVHKLENFPLPSD